MTCTHNPPSAACPWCQMRLAHHTAIIPKPICSDCQEKEKYIQTLEALVEELEAAQRADCINFHFWWMGAKGTNTYEGFETWKRDVRPNYCQCGGPEVRGGNCESCEKPVPPIRYEGERR